MEQALNYAKELLNENPQITPEEMVHRLHLSGYGVEKSLYAVNSILKPEVDKLCEIAIKEYKQPLVKREVVKAALSACGFSAKIIETVVSEKYPQDTSRYSVVFRNDFASLRTEFASAYNIGNGDFTAEAWVCMEYGAFGTIISRKPTAGCFGNGGFLLVLQPDTSIKFATDDGFGFYEVVSAPTGVLDKKFHHIMAVRRDDDLEIYFDFEKLDVRARTNRFPKLNIDNYLGISVGSVEQIQEPFNHFRGLIGECRLWNKAVTYSSKEEWANTDYIMPGLIGMWGFWNQSGEDYSDVSNNLDVSMCRFERWEL